MRQHLNTDACQLQCPSKHGQDLHVWLAGVGHGLNMWDARKVSRSHTHTQTQRGLVHFSFTCPLFELH